MTKSKRLDGKKKLIPLTSRMEADLRSFCRDKNIESEAELVRQAIARYIYADRDDETLKLQGLRQMREQITELRDMVDIFFNYVRLMHINILGYLPEIDGKMADAAFASATFRHNKFFSAFQDGLKNNPAFFERLLHTFYFGGRDGQD
ncbi:MAG: hypothetical protein LBG95_09765 [Treponema sp.]|jgi:hypothetical protein|nr:hypothetical protein [Treponema sp.]